MIFVFVKPGLTAYTKPIRERMALVHAASATQFVTNIRAADVGDLQVRLHPASQPSRMGPPGMEAKVIRTHSSPDVGTTAGFVAEEAGAARRLSARFAGTFERLLRWSPALLFALALVAVQHELKDREFADLSRSWRIVPWHRDRDPPRSTTRSSLATTCWPCASPATACRSSASCSGTGISSRPQS